MLEDIWNYRAQLTTKQKKDIVKNQVMFPVTVSNIYYINDIQIIRNIILEEFEKMLYTSDQDCHRATAAYYILIAFVEISQECAEAMPMLVQQ